MHTFVRHGLSAALLAVSTATMLAGIAPAQAATTFTTIQNSPIRSTSITATPKISTTLTTTTSSLTSRTGGGFVRPSSGNLIMQLTTSDCRLAGGTVIVPGDDRCGSIGAAYCRYPDTMAACITER